MSNRVRRTGHLSGVLGPRKGQVAITSDDASVSIRDNATSELSARSLRTRYAIAYLYNFNDRVRFAVSALSTIGGWPLRRWYQTIRQLARLRCHVVSCSHAD